MTRAPAIALRRIAEPCAPQRESVVMSQTPGVAYGQELIDPDDDFDQWYVDIVERAELADDAPVRGCKVIRPYGFALWEQMTARLDARIKATGVENAYFPLFIPASFLAREAEHIAGFAPEAAWV